MFCESCNEHPATVFISQIIGNEVTQFRLCETCARQRAEANYQANHNESGAENSEASLEEVVFGLFEEIEHRSDFFSRHEEEDSDEGNGFSMNEVFMELQSHPFNDDEFPSDEELADDLDEMDDLDEDFDNLPPELAAALDAANDSADDVFNASLDEIIKSNPFGDTSERREIAARRCPKCSITWDRLRQDGRAGCAHCYETFADQLHEVMQRVQHAPQHHGKKPRAAEKRRNRLEHLRARRDHRLEMLNRRLDEAVRAEKYEEAAKLRDQIKMVSSTIIQEN